jgi:hypothetical protein
MRRGPLTEGRRANRRSTAASCRPRAALFLRRLKSASRSAGFRQAAVVPPGGAPRPPGCVLARHARGRRASRYPEDLPQDQPPDLSPVLRARLRFVPPSRTPHESAPSADEVRGNIRADERAGISLFCGGGRSPHGARVTCRIGGCPASGRGFRCAKLGYACSRRKVTITFLSAVNLNAWRLSYG